VSRKSNPWFLAPVRAINNCPFLILLALIDTPLTSTSLSKILESNFDNTFGLKLLVIEIILCPTLK
jgi:hypothetical protein